MNRALLACLLALTLTGCAASNPATAPTQTPIQSADMNMAKGLLQVQTALTALVPLIATYPSLKTPLDQATASYNAIESGYLVWHSALVAGGNPDPTTLTTQITNLITSVTTLQGQFK